LPSEDAIHIRSQVEKELQ
jgi:hypothetical protein